MTSPINENHTRSIGAKSATVHGDDCLAVSTRVTDYSEKNERYFSGARKLFVDDLPRNATARLLEIGCGNGDTGAYAKAQEKCGWCCGVELCERAAREANGKLQKVIVGDIESIELDLAPASFDVLIMSEVLEHLANPWAVLRRLRHLLKPGAQVRSGSPNVCHHTVIRALLEGRWRYESKGIFDETHLRWFSPVNYREMFESTGFVVDSVLPADPLGPKGKIISALSFGRLRRFFHKQIYLKAHC